MSRSAQRKIIPVLILAILGLVYLLFGWHPVAWIVGVPLGLLVFFVVWCILMLLIHLLWTTFSLIIDYLWELYVSDR